MARALRFGIGLKDHLTGDLRRTSSSISRFARRSVLKFKRIARAATSVRTAVVGIAAGLVGRAVYKTLADFEDSLLRIKAAGGLSAEELERVTEKARELGATTERTAAEVMAGFLELRRGGFLANDMLRVIADSLDLAAVAEIEMADAAKTLVRSVKVYEDQGLSAAHASDVLVHSANSATTNIEEMTEAFQYALGNAKSALISFEELGAAIAVVADNAVVGSMAGRSLRGMLLRMINPTAEAAETIRDLGLWLDDVNPQVVGLAGAFENLSRAGAKYSDLTRIFEAQQITSANALLINVRRLRELREENENLIDTTKTAATVIRSGITGALKSMISAVQELVLKGGEAGLLGQLKGLLRDITEYLRSDAAAEFARGLGTEIGNIVRELREGFGQLRETMQLVSKDLVLVIGQLAKFLVNAGDVYRNAKWALLGPFSGQDDPVTAFRKEVEAEMRRAGGPGVWHVVGGFAPPGGPRILRRGPTGPVSAPAIPPGFESGRQTYGLSAPPSGPGGTYGLSAPPSGGMVSSGISALSSGAARAKAALGDIPSLLSDIRGKAYDVALQFEKWVKSLEKPKTAMDGITDAMRILEQEGSAFNVMRDAVLGVHDALVNSLASGLTEIISLTEDAGRAAEEMGKRFLQNVSQIMMNVAIRRTINAAFDAFGFFPGAASGGVFSGPATGYPVILHGREAVVPLGDQKITKAPLLSAPGSAGGGTVVHVHNHIQAIDNRSLDDRVLDSFGRQQARIASAIYSRASRERNRRMG